MEKETSRHTRLPKGPAWRETIQQTTAATSGAMVSIQSPHNDAVAVPYRNANTATCTSTRVAAAARADERILDITQTSPACRRRASDSALGPLYCVRSMNSQTVSRIKSFRGPRDVRARYPRQTQGSSDARCGRFSGTFNRPIPSLPPLTVASPFVNRRLLWLQIACQLFAVFHLPSAPVLPSIQIESRPAGLVMAVTDF